ncbi:SEC-C metal-binding domain-containing protein [Actinoplanes siamensis]|uniref:SEC-C metal-binding domain-containing protein n=1 Tax=Actinoplanes siamensis TaxID=1223317 RepID=UPI0035A23444
MSWPSSFPAGVGLSRAYRRCDHHGRPRGRRRPGRERGGPVRGRRRAGRGLRSRRGARRRRGARGSRRCGPSCCEIRWRRGGSVRRSRRAGSPCWCGSGAKYGECCVPRSRDRPSRGRAASWVC